MTSDAQLTAKARKFMEQSSELAEDHGCSKEIDAPSSGSLAKHTDFGGSERASTSSELLL
jgi:hypothetical protein